MKTKQAHRADDAPAGEPLSHKLLVAAVPIVVTELCVAARGIFERWHRTRDERRVAALAEAEAAKPVPKPKWGIG